MKKIRTFLAALLIGSLLLPVVAVSAAPAQFAAGDSKAESCKALEDLSPGAGKCDNPAGPGVNNLVELTFNLLSIVAGVIAVIMIIVSGLKYVSSQGDSNQISSAKRSLIYAIVGLAVVVFAQVIVKFVLANAAKA